MPPRHLLLYDGQCGLCNRALLFVLERDPEGQFAFAPLEGSTARQFEPLLPSDEKLGESLLFIEEFASASPRLLLRSQALFRLFWLLGGHWRLLGWLYFIPATRFFFDPLYRLVAHHRDRFFSRRCLLPQDEHRDRFLP